MRPANDELAGGVDMEDEVFVKESFHVARQLLDDSRQQDGLHVVTNAPKHLLVGLSLSGGGVGLDEIVVLGADDNGVDAHRAARLVVILHCHLALSVGAQVAYLATLAQRGELAQQAVGQVERQGHVARGLVAGIAKHHSLVAGALLLAGGAVHAAVDVAALLMDGREHAARVGVKFVLTLVVADAINHLARHFHQVDVGLAFHLAGNHHLSGSDKGLARHAAVRVEG